MAETKENIVMFPFMAQGHIIPFLALAFQLVKTNKYTITFVNTKKNINKLRSSLPRNFSFNLVEIPFNSSDHNLPPDTENTDSIPYNLVPILVEATLSFKPHFRELVSDLVSEQNGQKKPLCIITDFPEASSIHVTQLTDYLRVADGSDSFSVLMQKVLPLWKNVDGIMVNTVEELDKIGLMYFRRQICPQVWSVGPLLLSTGSKDRAGKLGISSQVCKNWLDTKPCSSVLYVSFGSQNTITPSQMMELALALEASGKYFIWVVRPPMGFDINSEFKANEWLPEGFEERITLARKGLVVHNWAPQVDILSHKSVSAFLSHCGWNSVLESLSQGVPIIGWPMAAEQFYNVKLLEEEIRVCVEVARGKSCEVKHQEIVAKIELVMNETEKGKEMKRKACEAKEIIENSIKDEKNYKGSSTKAMDEFFNAAFTMRESTLG
ncbi:hypothetical protein Ddye_023074 [Dipteronia dyeriana]|uniref:Glycosyltransferase n=1 Tax=Dipteronia dyeriana TaxID=168575 RepID=A0AAD9WS90_9ROSI|nr:hypothetical protein Ddye_023074 [Dipteronia dyeriana]